MHLAAPLQHPPAAPWRPSPSAAPWHPPAPLLHLQHPFCALALSCTPVTSPLHPGIHLHSLHPSIHLHSWCTLAPTCNPAAPWHPLLHPCCTMIPSTSASPWHSPAPLLHPGTVHRRAPFTSWFERCCRRLVFGGSLWGSQWRQRKPSVTPYQSLWVSLMLVLLGRGSLCPHCSAQCKF